MEHNKYWAERFEQLTEAELRKADDLSAEMVKEYRQIAQDLNDDIQRWYARFATENKMSLAEARRVLNARELAEFRWTVDEYIKNAKKDGLTGEYTQRLKNASARVHIDRLEAIRYQMAQSTLNASPQRGMHGSRTCCATSTPMHICVLATKCRERQALIRSLVFPRRMLSVS